MPFICILTCVKKLYKLATVIKSVYNITYMHADPQRHSSVCVSEREREREREGEREKREREREREREKERERVYARVCACKYMQLTRLYIFVMA